MVSASRRETVPFYPPWPESWCETGWTSSFASGSQRRRRRSRLRLPTSGVGDPVGQGLIHSYVRPGGNITGVTDLNIELSAKRLELFKELLPELKRVLLPYNVHNVYQAANFMQYHAAAHRLGLVLVDRPLRTIEEARDVLAGVRKEDIDGILAPREVDLNIPGFVLEATTKQGIPSMFELAFYLKDGGLASYGPSGLASGRWHGW